MKAKGNGNPLQYSCLENPRDGGAWWAAVYGVAQIRTRLKRLSSNTQKIKPFSVFFHQLRFCHVTFTGIIIIRILFFFFLVAPRGIQALSSWASSVKVPSPNHWTPREFPRTLFCLFVFKDSYNSECAFQN